MFMFILWYLVGVVSFIYWWTKDYDITLNGLPLLIGAGFMGPIAFVAGWGIHGKSNICMGCTIFKKRK